MKSAKIGMVMALGAGVVALGVAAPAGASTKSNTVNNCYSVAFNTAYNQQCGAGGASRSGMYTTTVDCSGLSGWESIGLRRNVGSTGLLTGSCTFGINSIKTSFAN